jgi:hypothetical protein
LAASKGALLPCPPAPRLQALLASPPPDPDAGSRLDLTGLTTFTIDDEGTTEVRRAQPPGQ